MKKELVMTAVQILRRIGEGHLEFLANNIDGLSDVVIDSFNKEIEACKEVSNWLEKGFE